LPRRLLATGVELIATAWPFWIALILGLAFGATELAESLSSWRGFSHKTWWIIVIVGAIVSLFAAFHKLRLSRDDLQSTDEAFDIFVSVTRASTYINLELRNDGSAPPVRLT